MFLFNYELPLFTLTHPKKNSKKKLEDDITGWKGNGVARDFLPAPWHIPPPHESVPNWKDPTRKIKKFVVVCGWDLLQG